ncbi:caspase family protein [Acinetobacter haemolyticus]|uniref:Caspase family protein n=1 Tax=Acinetobacter haemolyticus TaxID=29430 RepID=A0AAW4JHG7_ACIHA|nr:caspase family protein [Acinetobacter haemolyticus]MBO3659323.1 caspase family protein [Acinetobacter haemolyticus]
MDEIERTVGLIAVGVDKTGILHELKGAARGAKAIADWLERQNEFGVNTIIHLITDQNEKIVKYQDIVEKTQQLIDDGGLDLLILYFSGHGIVKNGSDEQILLSEAYKYPNEAISIISTFGNSRYSNIKHVLIISDACRNSVDPYSTLGGITGSPAFSKKNVVGVTPSKVDIFYATEPSKTAKELRGEGFFTKILLEALYQCPKEICEKQTNSDKLVIKPWHLENYLNDQVPKRAYLEMPSFEQVPDITTTSRDPLFLAYALQNKTFKNLKYLRKNISEDPFLKFDLNSYNQILHIESNSSSNDTDSKNSPNGNEVPSIRKNIAFKEILGELSKWSVRNIPNGLLMEAGIYDEVTEYIELEQSTNNLINEYLQINTGYHIVGEDIESIICNSNHKIIKNEIGIGENYIYIDGVTNLLNPSILVIFKSGTFIILPIFQNYIGTVHIKNGLTKSISLTLKKSKFHHLNFESFNNLSLRRACVAAFANNGKLGKLAKEDQFDLAHFIRRDKRIDPTLGIYASYAYTLLGNQDGVNSIYDYFRSYQRDRLQEKFHIPFDIGFLANKKVNQKKFITPFFPMMSLGWSLLDSYVYKEQLNPLILDLGKRRLNAEWSTFSVEHNLNFINAFYKGHI